MVNLHYRKDIDGLRAVAVIAVVLFHAFPKILSGGFIGVDVFFVISGFLITSIILREINEARFSFAHFYARRVRRLYPALLVMCCALLVFGWYGLWSFEYKSLGTHTFFSSIFFENIRLIRESAAYFHTTADHLPLLHLWSLSVEEQFYLVLPTLLIVAIRFKFLFSALIFLILASLVTGVVCTYTSPQWAFYGSFARFWELFSGVLLACLLTNRERWVRWSQLTVNTLAWASFLVLMFSIVYLGERHCRLPGLWIMLPVCAAVVLLLTGSQSWVGRKLLGHPWLVFIGLISYPLYLWHWPILSLASIWSHGPISSRVKWICIIFSLLLAVLTYLWVEKPVRRGGGKVAVFLLCCMLGLTLSSYGIKKGHVAAYCSHLPNVHKIDFELSRPWACNPPMPPFQKGVPCGDFVVLQYGVGAPEMLFLGDSNMEQYLPSVARMIDSGQSKERSIMFLTHGAWLPVPGHSKEADKTGVVLNFIAQQQRLKTIVIAAQWFAYFGDCSDAQLADYGVQLQNVLRAMKARGCSVYLVLGIPYADQLDPRVAVRRKWAKNFPFVEWSYEPDRARLAIETWAQKTQMMNTLFRQIASEVGVRVLDPLPLLADRGYYAAVGRDGGPIFKDNCHLALSFVHDSVHLFDEIL